MPRDPPHGHFWTRYRMALRSAWDPPCERRGTGLGEGVAAHALDWRRILKSGPQIGRLCWVPPPVRFGVIHRLLSIWDLIVLCCGLTLSSSDLDTWAILEAATQLKRQGSQTPEGSQKLRLGGAWDGRGGGCCV